MRKQVLSTLAVLFILVVGCSALPFDLSVKGSTVDVECKLLGEYPSAVSRVQLRESKSGAIVWEADSATGKVPAIWGFTLHVGENSVEVVPDHPGTYHVRIPAHGSTFRLSKGVKYRVTLWGKTRWFTRSAEFAFS